MEEQKILREIGKYIMDSPAGLSYYDFEAYCYENDKDDWIEALHNKNARSFIALLIRDKRKSDRVPYTNDMQTSVMHSLDAKTAYYERHKEKYEY